MAAIDNIIAVNVTAATQAVATQSFSIPLILGPTKGSGAASVLTCGSPADLLAAGYTAASVEYQYATAMCSQALRPAVFKVAQRSASGAIDADLAAVIALDDSWYGLCTPQASDDDIMTAATAIESLPKIYIAASAAADVGNSVATDVASLLQAKAFGRTALIWSPGSAALGIDAAWLGGMLPKQPGSATWAYKTLAGIAADTLSPTSQSIAMGVPINGNQGKAANIYQSVGGINVTEQGTMAGGGFIDTRWGTDSLRSMIKTNCYQALVNNDKIPFTDAGAIIFESAVKAAIDTHVGYGFISGSDPIAVSHVPVAQLSPTVRAQRICPPIAFSCRTSGAIQSVVISGSVNI